MEDELSGLWVLEALTRLGVDIPSVRKAVPEALDAVLGNQQEVHPDTVNVLLGACAENAGDPDIGLHLAEAMTEDMLGSFGFVLLNAPTVGRLLDLADRYYPLLYRGCGLTVTRQNGAIRMTYRAHQPTSVSARHLDEWTLGYFVHRIRAAVGPQWMPERVSMQYPRPARVGEVRSWFGPNVRFGRGSGSWFEVPAELANIAYDKADDGLLDLVVGVAERRLEEVLLLGTFVSQARMHLTDLVRSGRGGADVLAQTMLMSVSTLKRRLAAEGTTFRQLHDEVILDFAQRLLSETDLGVGTIARKLGYADAASFGRAFRRMSGVSPSEYRVP
jgi:AraC-like DNA-binding protein